MLSKFVIRSLWPPREVLLERWPFLLLGPALHRSRRRAPVQVVLHNPGKVVSGPGSACKKKVPSPGYHDAQLWGDAWRQNHFAWEGSSCHRWGAHVSMHLAWGRCMWIDHGQSWAGKVANSIGTDVPSCVRCEAGQLGGCFFLLPAWGAGGSAGYVVCPFPELSPPPFIICPCLYPAFLFGDTLKIAYDLSKTSGRYCIGSYQFPAFRHEQVPSKFV